jgi:hypothetical protein
MAQAAQAQAQAMAEARAMGLVPGQEAPPSGQPQGIAEASEPAQPGQPGQPTPTPAGKGSSEEPQGSVEPKASASGELEIAELTDGDWGSLPADVAKDLSEAGRQEVAPEYREAIQNYYKALAERARGN